jgi:hypothetical protein
MKVLFCCDDFDCYQSFVEKYENPLASSAEERVS